MSDANLSRTQGLAVRTLLLTDIESSTVHWERNPGEMGAAVARHEEIVRRAVKAEGGHVVKAKGEGDSTFSVFEFSGSAVRAAVSMQRAISAERWPTSDPIRVRVGMHTGEVESRDDDYFGRAVNRAARVRGLAVGATIVATESTVESAGGDLPREARLFDLGEHQLRGVSSAEHLFAVGHADLPDPQVALQHLRAKTSPPVPAALRLHADTALVGRDRDLAALRDLWSTAADGHASLALISGEPGVGKTRLAAAVAEYAAAQGAAVLYGRCDEEPQRLYQSVAEALASAFERLAPSELDALVSDIAADLAVVVPELGARIQVRGDASGERFTTLEAVASAFGRIAADKPTLVVLDDLHWADEPSLALVRHALRRQVHASLLFIATYRGTDHRTQPAFLRWLVEARRSMTLHECALRGLDRDDVAVLLGAEHEKHLGEVWAATDGNPFFIIELRRSLHDDHGGTPHSVRQAVAGRVERLPTPTQQLLRAAAIDGFDVDLRVVTVATDTGLDDANPAIHEGILEEIPDAAGGVQFGHGLIRSAVYDGLTALERADLHHRVAGAIESVHAGQLDEHASRLARHYRQAMLLGTAVPAYGWSMVAGRRAAILLAYEEAEEHYRAAADIARRNDHERVEAELELAEVLSRNGRPATGHAMADRAAPTAFALGDADLAGKAVFITRFGQALGVPDNLEAVETARRNLAEDSIWRRPLDVVYAGELTQTGRVREGIDLLTEVATTARERGDWAAYALALTGSHMYVDRLATPVDRILDATTNITPDAERGSVRLSPRWLRVQAESLRVGQLVTSGDIVAAREAAAEFAARYGDDTGMTEANVPLFAMSDALLSGDWNEWRRRLTRFSDEPELAPVFAFHVLGSEMMASWLQGRLRAALGVIEALPGSMMLVLPALALALYEAGRTEEANGVIAMAAEGDGLHTRALTVAGRCELALFGYAVAETGQRDIAATIYDLLRPRQGQIVAWAGWAFWGAVDGVLGRLAATLGEPAAAVEHLEAAHALLETGGWTVYATKNGCGLVSALLDRARPGDRANAARLADETATAAQRLGLRGVESELEALRRRLRDQ